MKYLAAALLLFFFYPSSAQNKDSLFALIPAQQTSAERLRIIYLLFGDDMGSSDPEKALYYYKKVLKLTRELGDKVVEAAVTSELGWSLVLSGNIVEGTKTLYSALEMAEESGSDRAIGIVYQNLYASEPLGHKLLTIQKGLAASERAKDYLFMCYHYLNLNDYYKIKGDQDSARYYTQRGSEIARTKVPSLIPYFMLETGRHEYAAGHKTVALEYYRTALQDSYSVEGTVMRARLYGALANYYLQENRDSAMFYANARYQIYSNGFLSRRVQAAQLLSDLYRGRNCDSAMYYADLSRSAKDSTESTAKIQQVQVMALLNETREENMTKERNRTLQTTAISLGVLTFIVLFFMLSHSMIANEKLIRFLGVIGLLIVFEFLNLSLHPYLEEFTHHSQVKMLLIMVGIAALLVPLHHRLEHFILKQLVEKNKRIRLAAAKRTIEKLDG